MTTPASDAAFMRAALALAARGNGECWPNPSVGCVIVNAGRVVGRGCTAAGGRPHAETEALHRAGAAARGATAYVTLEPCNHTGRTGPCTEALIGAGIARVVVAIEDPDPRVASGGIARLRQAGIAVTTGLLAAEAIHVTEGFLTRIRAGRPLITLKLATTLDGRIATATGQSQWITGPEARRAAHALRADHDAILVGAGTVAADNPRFDCRLPGARDRTLVRVIVDTTLRTPPSAAVVAGAPATPTWFITHTTDPARRDAITATGAELIDCTAGPAGPADGIDLADAMRRLAERGLTRVLVEGGGQIAASLLRADLVDRLAWFHAPSLIGGDGLPAVAPFGIAALASMPRFARLESRPCGPDMLTQFKRA